MKNSDKPIHPIKYSDGTLMKDSNDAEHFLKYSGALTGLSKREYFAGLAMQGLIAGRWACPDNVSNDPETISKFAVIHADDLLKQLEEIK